MPSGEGEDEPTVRGVLDDVKAALDHLAAYAGNDEVTLLVAAVGVLLDRIEWRTGTYAGGPTLQLVS